MGKLRPGDNLPSSEFVPVVWPDGGWGENTAKRSDGNLGFLGNNHSINDRASLSHQLDVTTPLTDFDETSFCPVGNLISRNDCALSRPHLDLNHADLGWAGCLGSFEVQLQG